MEDGAFAFIQTVFHVLLFIVVMVAAHGTVCDPATNKIDR